MSLEHLTLSFRKAKANRELRSWKAGGELCSDAGELLWCYIPHVKTSKMHRETEYILYGYVHIGIYTCYVCIYIHKYIQLIHDSMAKNQITIFEYRSFCFAR